MGWWAAPCTCALFGLQWPSACLLRSLLPFRCVLDAWWPTVERWQRAPPPRCRVLTGSFEIPWTRRYQLGLAAFGKPEVAGLSVLVYEARVASAAAPICDILLPRMAINSCL